MFISSFCSKLLIWVLVSFPLLLVPCTFSFISLSVAFIFSSNLQPYSTNFVIILITSVLNCASDRLAISSSLSCIFFWSFDLFFHLGHFFFFCLGVPEAQKVKCLRQVLLKGLMCPTVSECAGKNAGIICASVKSLPASIQLWFLGKKYVLGGRDHCSFLSKFSACRILSPSMSFLCLLSL